MGFGWGKTRSGVDHTVNWNSVESLSSVSDDHTVVGLASPGNEGVIDPIPIRVSEIKSRPTHFLGWCEYEDFKKVLG